MSIDLATMPLEEVAKLRDQADQAIRDRQCKAWLQNGPSCNKEEGHNGPHEGTAHGYSTNTGHNVRCVLMWDAV